MDFTAATGDLRKALQALSSLTPQRSDGYGPTEPDRLTVTADVDAVTLAVTTKQAAAAMVIPAKVETPGTAHVRRSAFKAALLGAAKTTAKVTSDGQALSVACKDKTTHLQPWGGNLPPAGSTELDAFYTVTLGPEQLRTLSHLSAIPTQEWEGAMQGIGFEAREDGALIAVATDGYKLAAVTIATEGAPRFFRASLPAEITRRAQRAFGDTEPLTLSFDATASHAQLKGPRGVLVCQTLAGRFPAWERVTERTDSAARNTVTFKRADLVAALDGLLPLCAALTSDCVVMRSDAATGKAILAHIHGNFSETPGEITFVPLTAVTELDAQDRGPQAAGWCDMLGYSQAALGGAFWRVAMRDLAAILALHDGPEITLRLAQTNTPATIHLPDLRGVAVLMPKHFERGEADRLLQITNKALGIGEAA